MPLPIKGTLTTIGKIFIKKLLSITSWNIQIFAILTCLQCPWKRMFFVMTSWRYDVIHKLATINVVTALLFIQCKYIFGCEWWIIIQNLHLIRFYNISHTSWNIVTSWHCVGMARCHTSTTMPFFPPTCFLLHIFANMNLVKDCPCQSQYIPPFPSKSNEI